MATTKLVQNDGDKVTWKLKITNLSNVNCFGTQIVFTIPTGVSLTGPLGTNGVSISVPKGSFNPTSNTWFIGEISANSSSDSVEWEFTVDDITQANELDDSFIIEAVVTSRCGDENSVDNTLELMITVGEDCSQINITLGGETNTVTTDQLQITV
jgi:hypothetical protein